MTEKRKQKRFDRRREVALHVYEDTCRELDDDDPDEGIVLDNIEEALKEDGLPIFATDAEVFQVIEEEGERELRACEIVFKHLEAAGPSAVLSDVMEAVKAEIKKEGDR